MQRGGEDERPVSCEIIIISQYFLRYSELLGYRFRLTLPAAKRERSFASSYGKSGILKQKVFIDMREVLKSAG